MRSATCAHGRGVRSKSGGPTWLPCERETRDAVCGPGSKVDRCVSSLRLQYSVPGSRIRPWMCIRSPSFKGVERVSQTIVAPFRRVFATKVRSRPTPIVSISERTAEIITPTVTWYQARVIALSPRAPQRLSSWRLET